MIVKSFVGVKDGFLPKFWDYSGIIHIDYKIR